MEAPRGLSGLQDLPKDGQSVGFFIPRQICSDMQLLGSMRAQAGGANRLKASKEANWGLS